MSSFFKVIMAMIFSLTMASAAQAGEDVPDTVPGTTKVTAEQLIELVQKHPNMVMIDARKPSDRAKGFIEGSVALVDTDTTPETLAKVAPNKAAPVVFYCNGVKCGRSVNSAKVASGAGYSKIYWFRGGWEEWIAKGFPVAK